MRVIFSYTN